MTLRATLILLFALASPPTVSGQTGGDVSPTGRQTPSHADGGVSATALVAQLDDIDFQRREEATKRLIQLGADAYDALVAGYGAAETFEARLRIREIAEQAFFWHELYGRNGFLGIQLQPYTSALDKRVPQGQLGIFVAAALPGLSAAEAGVEDGDLIIAVDGQPLSQPPADGGFADSIRGRKPGTVLTLTVFRGDRQLQFTFPLGHRPLEYYTDDARTQPELIAQFNRVARRFPRWWAERFEGAAAARRR